MKQCGSCGFAYEGEICPKCIADFARHSTPAALVTDILPGYEQFEKLGRGGMGTVYKARQVSLDRWIAVKILSPELAADEDYVRRFLIEARTAGKLRHENLVSALDCGQHEGRYFMVMEFVEGRTLEECGQLPEEEALDVVRQVAEGLQYAWERHVIHRDIKPQNIMLTKTGGAKLCDLGLCRDVRSDSRLTATGRVHCTPAYASPEQARGEKDLDTRTDIYSLGITLYQLLTGERPFSGEAAGDLLIKQATEKPVPPIRRNPRISAAANQLVMWMIEKSRDRRPANPAIVAARIREILQPVPRIVSPRRRVPVSPRRSSTPWIFLGTFAAVLFAGLVVFLSNRPDPPVSKPRSEEPAPRREPERPPVASEDTKKVEKIVEVQKPEPKREEQPPPKVKDEAAEKQTRFEEALGRVKAHFDAREWTKARAALDDALAVKPSDPSAWEWKEKFAEAEKEEVYTTALARAEKRLAARDWEEAFIASETALRVRPGDARALAIRLKADVERAYDKAIAAAEAHVKSREWKEAVAAGEQASKIKAGDSRAKGLVAKAKELATRDPSYLEVLRTLSGHSGGVTTAVFIRNGTTILSGGEDGSIKVWDVKSGKALQTLTGHGDIIWQLRSSADGKIVVSAGKDSTFRIWDAVAGKLVDTVRCSLDGTTPLQLYAVSLSPDARTLVAAGNYPAFFIMDPVSKEERNFKVDHADSVSALAFSPDGKLLASGSWDETIKLWEPTNSGMYRLVRTLRGHEEAVRWLAFSPDGRTLASAGFDKTIRLWEVASGKDLKTLTGHEDKVTAVAFSPDGRILASGSFDKTIRLWDVATGEELRILKGNTKTVRELNFSPDGKMLLSAGEDGTIRLWSRPRK